MTGPQATPASEARIEITCRQCGRRLRRRPRDAGRMIACPACAAWIMVPTPRRPRASDVLVVTPEDLTNLPAAAARRRAVTRTRKSARPRPLHTRLRARHVGKKCPYCITLIPPKTDLVVCPECGIPHHTECWQENGGCTTWGCKATPHARPFARTITLPSPQTTSSSGFSTFTRSIRLDRQPRSSTTGCAKGCVVIGGTAIVVAAAAGLVTHTRSPFWIFFAVVAIVAILRIAFGKWRIET